MITRVISYSLTVLKTGGFIFSFLNRKAYKKNEAGWKIEKGFHNEYISLCKLLTSNEIFFRLNIFVTFY